MADIDLVLEVVRNLRRSGYSVVVVNVVRRSLHLQGHKHFDNAAIEQILRGAGFKKRVGYPTSFDYPEPCT